MKKIIFTLIFTIILASNTLAARLVTDLGGTYCIKDDNLQAKNEWVEIEGKSYYFGNDHYMLKDTLTPDGYKVDKDGVWDGKEKVESGSNKIIMPNDTYSFWDQKYDAYRDKTQKLNKDLQQGKIGEDEYNKKSQKAYDDMYKNAGSNTSYDFEMRKESVKNQIEDTKEKIQKSMEKYKKYISENMPAEIINTLAENIRLMNTKLENLQKELDNMK